MRTKSCPQCRGTTARAIQAVCEHLSDEAWSPTVIKRHLKCASASELPIQLQIVFKVRLVRNGAVSIATDVGYVDSRLYDMLNPTR